MSDELQRPPFTFSNPFDFQFIDAINGQYHHRHYHILRFVNYAASNRFVKTVRLFLTEDYRYAHLFYNQVSPGCDSSRPKKEE